MGRMTFAGRIMILALALLLCVTSVAMAEPWFCLKCGARNNGNFCTICGEPKPHVSKGWICSRCGTTCEDSYKFCPNCGEPRSAGGTTSARVSLDDLKAYAQKNGGLKSYTNEKDILGNIYDWAFLSYMVKRQSYTWDIGRKYTKLYATVAVSAISGHNEREEGKGHVYIYGDDRLLFDSGDIAVDMKSYPIEVDISGVTDLKIEMNGGNDYYRSEITLLAEVWLQ